MALRDEARPDQKRSEAPSQEKGAEARSGESRENETIDKAQSWIGRHPLALAFSVAIILALIAAGYLYWDNSSHFETTDDAFIDARQFSIAPKVAGYIVAVYVTDNQHLAEGEPIAQLDRRDYEIAVNQAEAQRAAAEANIRNINAQITAQQAQVTEAKAQLSKTQAALRFAAQEAERSQALVRHGTGTLQREQRTSSELQQQQSSLARARGALEAANAQAQSLQAQKNAAEADLARAVARLDQARVNLSETRIVAAQPGRIARLTAAVGEYTQTGTSLSMFVPDALWVTSNFKETQLDRMRPGQSARIHIDAYPERSLNGRVDSMQPGSGAAFSLLPPENATGNYVKIVQRVPVKITMDDIPKDLVLGPGMSAVPTVRVDPTPSLYEQLRRAL